MTDKTIPNDLRSGDAFAKFIADLAVNACYPAQIALVAPAAAGRGLPGEIPVHFDRKAQSLQSVHALFEQWRIRPERRKGTATVDTLESFIDLVKRHADAESSVIFADATMPRPALTAVLDYHDMAGVPGWGQHRVVYPFPVTDEFKGWLAMDAKPMEQREFAEFLEEHAAELAAPMDQERSDFERLFKCTMATPADMITLSRHLEILVGRKVTRAERLQTGEATVEFIEEHTTKGGEKVDIPGCFMVNVPPFVDGDTARFPARLRYRVGSGSIIWFYQLYRPMQVLRDRVRSDLDYAAEDLGLPKFQGKPEMPAA